MKKLSFLLMVFFLNLCYLKAECSYKDIKELNTLASYITTNYEYNEENNTFNIIYYNVIDRMVINYNQVNYNPNNNEVIINNITSGTSVKATAEIKSGDDCYGEKLRTIITNIPYLNEFYGSSECEGHMDLNVCNSRFLDYKLTETTFKSLLNKVIDNKLEEETDNNDDIINESLIDTLKKYVKEYYIPVILVILSSALTYTVYSTLLRKIKHGL